MAYDVTHYLSVGDAHDIAETMPSEANAQALLAKSEQETALLDLLSRCMGKLPSEENAEALRQALKLENGCLTTLSNAVSQYLNPAEDYVPTYFKANVSDAIERYRKNSEAVGNDGDSFIFITDTHWGYNQMHSPALIKHILKNTNLRNVICGGDALDSGSKASELKKGYDHMAAFSFVPGGLKFVLGNHDFNKNGHGDDSSYWFSLPQTYALFYPQAAMEMQDVQCVEPSTGYYEISYYFDVPATNTRYLIVSVPFGSVYDVTKNWAVSQVSNNPTKNFVIVSHYLYANDAIPGGADALINALKGYSNIKGWLFGHLHYDYVMYTSTGIPIVGTDTDSSRLAASNPYEYEIGTLTEQAFDIVTVDHTHGSVLCSRVGRGKHRKVNGGVNSVAAAGTASLTTSITSPTWSSSDTDVATVSDGTVTGVAAGSAVIKAAGETEEEYWYVTVS